MAKSKPNAKLVGKVNPPDKFEAQTPIALLSNAVKQGVGIDVIERLIVLEEKYRAGIARQEYVEAFSRFQSIVPPIIKDRNVSFPHKRDNGATSYNYAPLATIEKTIKPHLAECGLAYRWDQKEVVENGVKKIHVYCIVSHRGGHQEISSPLTGTADDSGSKNLIQQNASTITYLRRYTLTGILGLSSADHDDDGHASHGQTQENGEVQFLPHISDVQFQSAIKKIRAKEWTVDHIKQNVTLMPDKEQALRKIEDEVTQKV